MRIGVLTNLTKNVLEIKTKELSFWFSRRKKSGKPFEMLYIFYLLSLF